MLFQILCLWKISTKHKMVIYRNFVFVCTHFKMYNHSIVIQSYLNICYNRSTLSKNQKKSLFKLILFQTCHASRILKNNYNHLISQLNKTTCISLCKMYVKCYNLF